LLISRGNSKLGTLPSFSLPVLTTCPGKTRFCTRYCYGLKGMFTQEKLKEMNDKRLDASLKPDFVPLIIKEIKKTKALAFRLHVVGDFYSTEYIEKWIDIANSLLGVIFFGSTRSWRCDHLSPTLIQFRDLDNVFIKASIDITDDLDPVRDGWWVWSVEGEGTPCPHDYGNVSSCAECRRCFMLKEFNLSLRLRWGKKSDYFSMN
jgi:hypothetical protein